MIEYGKPSKSGKTHCKHGHEYAVTGYLLLQNACAECSREQRRKYYARDRQKELVRMRVWRVANKEKVNARSREYWVKNREIFNQKRRENDRAKREAAQ